MNIKKKYFIYFIYLKMEEDSLEIILDWIKDFLIEKKFKIINVEGIGSNDFYYVNIETDTIYIYLFADRLYADIFDRIIIYSDNTISKILYHWYSFEYEEQKIDINKLYKKEVLELSKSSELSENIYFKVPSDIYYLFSNCEIFNKNYISKKKYK